MRSKAQARAPIILHDLAPGGHGGQLHRRLRGFRSQNPGAVIRCREERKGIVPQRLNRPCRIPAREPKTPEAIRRRDMLQRADRHGGAPPHILDAGEAPTLALFGDGPNVRRSTNCSASFWSMLRTMQKPRRTA